MKINFSFIIDLSQSCKVVSFDHAKVYLKNAFSLFPEQLRLRKTCALKFVSHYEFSLRTNHSQSSSD